MLDPEQLALLLLEEQYPILSDEQLEQLCEMFDNIYQAAYMGCLMKAQSNEITVGPITIKNDTSFWTNMANGYRQQWLSGAGSKSRSITGKTVGRADE